MRIPHDTESQVRDRGKGKIPIGASLWCEGIFKGERADYEFLKGDTAPEIGSVSVIITLINHHWFGFVEFMEGETGEYRLEQGAGRP